MSTGPRLTLWAITGLAAMAAAGYVIAAAPQTADAETARPDGRAALRAFYTAPPVIPHIVQHQGNAQCAYCHQEVRHIGNRVSVQSPHSHFQNCQQCHVGINLLNANEAEPTVESTWQGAQEPRKGDRATVTSPPTIPHRIFLRENCNSCHATDTPNETMRGPHPERSSCRQCHVADLDAEFGGVPR